MAARVMLLIALALTLTIVSAEVSGEENTATMSKEELISALTKSRAAHSAAQKELSSTKMTLTTVQVKDQFLMHPEIRAAWGTSLHCTIT